MGKNVFEQIYTGSRLERVRDAKEITHLQVLVVTKHFNINISGFGEFCKRDTVHFFGV